MNRQTVMKSQRKVAPIQDSVLQRRCSCGQHAVAGGKCENCKKERQQGSAAGEGTRSEAPSIMAKPVSPQARTYIAPRFSHDFSGVRVHAEDSVRGMRRAKFIGEIDDTPAQVPGKSAGSGKGGTAKKASGGNCSTICNKAYADASLNSGGGGVICDGATKCACVFDVPPLKKGTCPGFDDLVVKAHERRHLSDVDCNSSGGLHRPPFRVPSDATSSECKHRRESIVTIDALLPKAAGICKTGITSIRGQLNTWVKANCS